jgi:putative transposase
METPPNVVRLRQPEDVDDRPVEVLRTGDRRPLAQAFEMEADVVPSAMQDLRLPEGRVRLVRYGHGPERALQTGIGLKPIACVRVQKHGWNGFLDRGRFTSTLTPK